MCLNIQWNRYFRSPVKTKQGLIIYAIVQVLSNWRNRFERSSKYTSPELHTQLVKRCIDIALECVHPDKEKRPNVSNIIEILNAAEKVARIKMAKIYQ